MILNLLSVIHGRDAHATVAVAASNKEALENIGSKLAESREFAHINRIFMRLGKQSIRRQWQETHGDDARFFTEKKFQFLPGILEEKPMLSSTLHSLDNLFCENVLFDYVIVDE